MSTDVEFRLTLTRDPQARAALRQWEADLLASIARVEQARLRSGLNTIATLHRANMMLVNQQAAMHNQNQAAQQAALQRSLAAQAAMWRNHAAQIAAIMAQANNAGLPPVLPPGVSPVPGAGAGSGGGRAGSGMFSGVAGLGRAYLGVQGVRAAANFATDAVQQYATLESNQIQLGVLTGSKGAARELVKELKTVQQAMGVSITALTAASKMMIGFGVTASDSADKLKRFSAITGGNEDAMQRLGRAYGQVKGLGKLMAEETNQMIDAGFSPLIAIASRTGESIGQVRERMKDGAVSFDEVRQAIEAATEAGGKFAGIMEAMEKSTAASIGRMGAAWLEFRQKVGGELANAAGYTSSGSVGFLGGSGGMTQFLSGAYLGGQNTQEGFESISKGKAQGSSSSFGQMALGVSYGMLGNSGEGKRALSLDEQREVSMRRLSENEKKAKDARAAALEAEKKAYDLRGVSQAKEIAEAQKLNDLRLKSAKDELKARKEILEEAKKTTAEAAKSLMTAQERFGAMTTEEQNAAVNDLLNARRNGVGNLSLEQINRIKSIGTKEADQISGAALRNRAGAAFGLTNPEDSIAGRTASIQQEIARLQNSNAARMPVTRKERRDNDARINQLRQEASQFEGTAERARGQYQQQVGVRSSLFTQERRDLQLAERKQLAVEANVQQSIQFVAKFDQTAQQIATQVMELFTTASNEQMKEVLKIINPIKKQVEAAQMRRIATAQQG